MRTPILWLLILLPELVAQTFIVDANNGPGTNFTSLPTAVATVPDGATLLVLPGTYTGFTMTGKGLTVLGTGAVIQGSITISTTAAHQVVTMRGLSWSVVPTNTLPVTPVIALDNCQGPVLLANITQPANAYVGLCPTLACSIAIGIRATSCSQLYLRDCDIRCTVELSSCEAVIESCFLSGESLGAIYLRLANSPSSGNPPRPALSLTNSNVQVSGSSRFESGSGGNLGFGQHIQGASGILVQNGSLRLLDGTIVAGASGISPVAYTIEQLGTVQLRIAPRAVLTGALNLPTQGPQSGSDTMPALTGNGAAAGGTLTATTATENGDLVVLAIGLPGPAVVVPGIQNAFWLDPVVHVFATVGVQQAGVPIRGSVAVPAGPAFVGLRLNWQAACYGSVTGFQASNPVGALVH